GVIVRVQRKKLFGWAWEGRRDGAYDSAWILPYEFGSYEEAEAYIIATHGSAPAPRRVEGAQCRVSPSGVESRSSQARRAGPRFSRPRSTPLSSTTSRTWACPTDALEKRKESMSQR